MKIGKHDILLSLRARISGRVGAQRIFLHAGGVAVYIGLLAALNFPFLLPTALYVIAVSFSFRNRISAVSLSNIVFWLVTGSLMTTAGPWLGDPNHQWPYFPDGYEALVFPGLALKLFLAGVIVAIYALLYFCLFSLHRRMPSLRHPVAWCMVAFLAAQAFCRLRLGPVANAIGIGLFFAISKSFWVISYQLSEVDLLKRRPFWAHFGTLSSPWQTTWVNSGGLRGYGDFLNHDPTGEEEVLGSLASGIALLFRAAALHMLARGLEVTVFLAKAKFGGFDVTGLPSLVAEFRVAGILDHHLSRGLSWVFVLGKTLHFLLEYAAISHGLLSVARICGFRLRRNVYKPYLATSFNNFLGRIYFYYISILQRFFFFPIWARTRFLPSKRLRVFVTHFLTITLGGAIYNYERSAPYELEGSFLGLSLYRLPYFVCLGICSGVAALLPEPPAWAGGKAARAVRVFLYLVVYSLCYALQFRPSITIEIPLSQRLGIIAYLFGF